jgi:hypothetical protein
MPTLVDKKQLRHVARGLQISIRDPETGVFRPLGVTIDWSEMEARLAAQEYARADVEPIDRLPGVACMHGLILYGKCKACEELKIEEAPNE